MRAARFSLVSLVLRLWTLGVAEGDIGRAEVVESLLSAGVGKLRGRPSIGGVVEPFTIRSSLDWRSLRVFLAYGRSVSSTARSKRVVDVAKSAASTSMRVFRGRRTRSLNATAHITFTLSPPFGASSQWDNPNGAWLRFVGSPRGF